MKEGSKRARLPAASRITAVGLTICLGAAGGALFAYLNMPLAWLIGAMCVTTTAALSGAPLQRSDFLFKSMVVVLGIMLGGAFTPDALERAYLWLGSLTALLAYVAVVTLSLALVLRRTFGFGRTTAYFSAAPGGFSAMVLLGGAMGGDERTIGLMHSVRLLLTVLIIPFWFRLFQGYEPAGMSILSQNADITITDTGILVILAVAGLYGGRFLRLPAPYLLGPLMLSSGAHLTGLTDATPPGMLVAIAQVVIGTAIGCRFTGVPVRRVLNILMLGAAATLFMLATAAALAYVLAEATGLPFEALILALSPGGVAEMSLISLSMGIDTAFVATHHIVRILFLVACAPIAFRLLARWLGAAEREGEGETEPPSRQDRG